MAAPQLPLFSPSETDRVAELQPADFPAELTPLAATLPPRLWLGGQSWTYMGWVGHVYGEATKEKQLLHQGLTAYVKHPLLRCVEIDRSYYEPLTAETYAHFAAQTPDDFRFVVKAHEDVTITRYPMQARHGGRAGQPNPRLLDVAYATDAVVGPYIEGLKQRAGALVFQFSPFDVRSPKRFADKLFEFLSKLPKGPTYAIELRNKELLTGEYGAALKDAGAVHCFNGWERMPSVLEQRDWLHPSARTPLVVRWLTRPGDTHEAARLRFQPFNALVEEDLPRREDVAELTVEALKAGAEALVTVANKVEGCGPESIVRLARSISAKLRGA